MGWEEKRGKALRRRNFFFFISSRGDNIFFFSRPLFCLRKWGKMQGGVGGRRRRAACGAEKIRTEVSA